MYATFAPSGDQRGHFSCAPDVLVRLRTGPFSTGAEKTSPRAPNTTRSPFGLIDADSTRFAALTRAGRRARPSSGTAIDIGELLRDLASRISRPPFNSYTIRLCRSVDGQRTSWTLLKVTCVVFPPLVS